MLYLLSLILSKLNSCFNMLLSIRKTLGEIQAQQAIDSQAIQEIKAQVVPGPAVKILFIADLEGQITIGVTQMNMTDTQQVGLTIQPVDAKGNPAQVDGAPVWASSNTEVVSITAAPDGMSATAVAVGPLGTATISVKADADLGAGVTTIAGTLDITITGGVATTVTITAGTPTDQVPPPPPPPTV